MYKSFRAQNFRCFDDLQINNFNRINIITGKNNVGKTTLLEALWIFFGYHNPTLPLTLRKMRGFDPIKIKEFLYDLFLDFDPDNHITLTGIDFSDQEKKLSITVEELPYSTSKTEINKDQSTYLEKDNLALSAKDIDPVASETFDTKLQYRYTGEIEASIIVKKNEIQTKRPKNIKEPECILFSPGRPTDLEILAERFGTLAVKKNMNEIINAMKIIEPRLESLSLQYVGGRPVIHGDIGLDRLVPMPLMGDGIGQLLRIILAIPEAKNGFILVDEFESGFHYLVLKDVWKAIEKMLTHYNVQFFTTTHGEECILSALDAFYDDERDIVSLIRIEKVKGKFKSISYNEEILNSAFEMDSEVR